MIAAYTNDDYVTSQLLQIVKPYDASISKCLAGILNSNSMAYYFRKKYNRQDKTFPEIRIYELASLPIKKFNEQNAKLVSDITKLVDLLLTLNEQKGQTTLPGRLEALQSRIDHAEQRINGLVYALYGLTEEEIALIENS